MSHYYSEVQKSPLNLRKIKVSIKGICLEFYTGSGTFSKSRLDKGSRILIENAQIKNGSNVLDIGCGYGTVGISILKLFPKCMVVMTDINRRAVELCKKNARLNKVKATVYCGNLLEKVKDKFDAILTNPPMCAGKEVCFEIIEKAKEFLKKGGTLQMVAKHNKGGKSLKQKMIEEFGNAEEIAKESGYRVYVSTL